MPEGSTTFVHTVALHDDPNILQHQIVQQPIDFSPQHLSLSPNPRLSLHALPHLSIPPKADISHHAHSHPPTTPETPETPASLSSPITGVIDLTGCIRTVADSPVTTGGFSDIYRGVWTWKPIDELDTEGGGRIETAQVIQFRQPHNISHFMLGGNKIAADSDCEGPGLWQSSQGVLFIKLSIF
jgi:hypothetical protein